MLIVIKAISYRRSSATDISDIIITKILEMLREDCSHIRLFILMLAINNMRVLSLKKGAQSCCDREEKQCIN